MVATVLLVAALAGAGSLDGGPNPPRTRWIGQNGIKSVKSLGTTVFTPTASVWIDAVSSGSASAATLQFSMTIAAVANYLVVGVSDELSDVTSVTWNGSAMTQQIKGKRGGGGNGGAYLYTLAAPTTGPGGVTITCSSVDSKVAGAISLINAGTLAWSISNAGDSSVAPSATTLASSNGSVIVANLYGASGTTSTTPGPRQTEWWTAIIGAGANQTRGAGSTQGGNGSAQVVGWVFGTAKQWALMALEVKP